MKIIYKENSVIIDGIEDFDIKQSCECGQCFRWNESENGYKGVIHNRLISVSQPRKNHLVISGADKGSIDLVLDYFDLDNDYALIKESFSDDETLAKAVGHGWGIRVFKQDIWETLISFIISANNNIPRIKGIIERLCENFGEKMQSGADTFYSFPEPQTLAQLDEKNLAVIRAGFRTKYILDAARKVSSGEIDLKMLPHLPYEEAKRQLMTIKGVGLKVSDCVLLFGAHRLEAFPVDVWIKRILENYYGSDYDIKKFGRYAGVAQQYLFYYGRENKIK